MFIGLLGLLFIVFIFGVQGVGFRFWALRVFRKLQELFICPAGGLADLPLVNPSSKFGSQLSLTIVGCRPLTRGWWGRVKGLGLRVKGLGFRV